MKKGNFGSLFRTSSLALQHRRPQGRWFGIVHIRRVPGHLLGSGGFRRLRPRGHRLADFMHVAGLEQLLRRFPLRLGVLGGAG